MMHVTVATLCAAVLISWQAADHTDNERFWPQWRGPYATGVSRTADPPIEWSETKNIRWKVELPGRGSGTPVVWGDRLFVLSAVPAQLFTPPGNEDVWLTENVAVNGAGMRAWLQYGDAFVAQSGDLPEELVRDRALEAMAVYALALVDAKRNEDKAGIQDAYRALERTILAERERREAAERDKEDS